MPTTHWILLSLLTLPAAVLAQPRDGAPRPDRSGPPSARDRARSDAPDRPGAREDDARPYWRSRMQHEVFDPARWETAAAFLKQHSPNRWAAFEAMPEGRGKFQIRRVILMRWHGLEMLEAQSDTALYTLAVGRIETEDAAWGLSSALASATSDADRDRLRDELKAKVRELVDLQLKERSARIDRLDRALAREREKLTADQQRVDALADEQFQRWSTGKTDPADISNLGGPPQGPPRDGPGRERANREGMNRDGAHSDDRPDRVPDGPSTRHAVPDPPPTR